mgnify:CR=1 FL=1
MKARILILITLIVLALAAESACSSSKDLVYVKVIFANNRALKIECFQVLHSKISFSLRNSAYENVTIVVDPRSGIRPGLVKVNGEWIPQGSPHLRYGIYELSINAKSLGSGIYEIYFEEYEHLPPAYILFIPENFTKAEAREIHIDVERWKVFGTFLYVLTLSEGTVRINTSKPYSLLSEKIVEYLTPLGVSKGRELIYYVQDSEFKIEGDIISLAYKPILILYEDVIVSDTEISIFNIPYTGFNGSYFLLLYKPDYLKVLTMNGEVRPGFLPFNLSVGEHSVYVIRDLKFIEIKYRVEKIRLRLKGKSPALPPLRAEIESGGYAYQVENVEEILPVTPSLELPLKITLYYKSVKVGEYLLYTVYDGLTLEVPLSRVKVYVTDVWGRELKSGILSLYSLSVATEEKFSIKDGEVDLGFLSEGDYLVRVILDGVEVCRETFNPVETAELRIRCEVSDFKITIKDLDLSPVENVTVFLYGAANYSKDTDPNGIAFFKQIPMTEYEIEVRRDGTTFYNGVVDLHLKDDVKIVLEVRSLKVKVLDIFGNPISEARITLELKDGDARRSGKTDENGRVYFELLPLGTYTLTCRIGGYEKTKEFTLGSDTSNFVTLKTDVCFVLFGFALDVKILTLLIVATFIIPIVMKIARRRGEIEIA